MELKFSIPTDKQKTPHHLVRSFFGDPYGNRTHVTAVKGRCLNRLTNGPGSGDLTRTGDRPGMNRVLYQLSYAAIDPASFGCAEISFVIISLSLQFVKTFIRIFTKKLGNTHHEVNCVKYAKELALFALGGGAYVGLELLWRRRSHVSMFAAGGTCFLLLGELEKRKFSLPVRAAAGAGVITAVELGAGLLVNRDHHVWDYRAVPGNFRGQICPVYTALWAPLGLLGMTLYAWAEGKLEAGRLGGHHLTGGNGSVPAR